jgi:hypothetical protein
LARLPVLAAGGRVASVGDLMVVVGQKRQGTALVRLPVLAAEGRVASVGDLMVVVGQKSTADDSAGRRQVDGQLVGDGRMLDVRDTLGREQCIQDEAVLTGLAGRQRGQRTHGQARVEPDAAEVTGADAGPGEDQQPMLRQQGAQFLDVWKGGFPAAIHDRASPDLHDLEPGVVQARRRSRWRWPGRWVKAW